MRRTVKLFGLTSLLVGVLALTVSLAPFSMCQNPALKVFGTPPGWSDEINLSQNQLNNLDPAVAVNQDNVHVVWRYNSGSTRDIVYKKSTDGGRTWCPMITLGSSPDIAQLPQIALSQNNIHVVWEDRQDVNGVYYRNSTDGGESWNPARRITPNIYPWDAVAPDIFVNNSNVHIVWNDFRDGADGEVYYRRSLDNGITFDNGQGVDQDRRISFSPATVTKPLIGGYQSNISVAWMDERNGNFEIYWEISKDNGNTWEDGLGNIGVDRRITFTSVFDYAIAMNGSKIHFVWSKQTWPGPTYTLYYCNSTDNGVTWNTPIILTGPTPLINAPDIDISGDLIHIVWHDRRDDGTHNEIYYKNSTDGGISWGSDIRLTFNNTEWSDCPKIAVQNDTRHIVWFNWYGSNLRDVFYKRHPDFPDTFPPDHSNEIPFPDSFKDAPGTNVSVHVTDSSGVNESTIQLYVNGSPVAYTLTPITDGYNVSWDSPGFEPGVVTCRIVADDNLSNHLDYNWSFTVLALYNSPLHEGWNLISVPFAQVNTSIKEVLKDIAGKWDYIQVYNATDPDHWKTNLTYRPDQLNDLNALNHKMGFWINVTEPNVNLTVRGNISAYTIIPLYAGWNLVGYPTLNTKTVGNALFGTTADKVEVFDLTDPYRLKEVGSTYVMKPGEGYWVHVVADSIWTINW
jgi:hypothetical protein